MNTSTPPDSPISCHTPHNGETKESIREKPYPLFPQSTINTSVQQLDTGETKHQTKIIASPSTYCKSDLAIRVIKLLQSANGLDKCIRTIQYTSRLLAHIMLVKKLHTTSTLDGTKAIRRQFGLTRKLLRGFNNLGQFQVMIKILGEYKMRFSNDPVAYLCDLVEAVGYMGFGLTDSLGYLPDAGITNIPLRDVVDKAALIFWLHALIASIVGGIIKIRRLQRRLSSYQKIFPNAIKSSDTSALQASNQSKNLTPSIQLLPPTPPLSPINKESNSVPQAAQVAIEDLTQQNLNNKLNLAGNMADILFPLAALSLCGAEKLSDGMLGLAGCISSVVGVRKAWKSIA